MKRKHLARTVFAIFLCSAAVGEAAVIRASASLDYAQEVNPNPLPSDATGTALVTFDTATNLLDLQAVIEGIFVADVSFPSGGLAFGNNGPFHIHNAAFGVNGPIVVPFNQADFFSDTATGMTIVANDIPFDGPLTGPGLIAELAAGRLYLNLHTTPNYASGEIRGQLSVPEPSSLLLMLIGSIGLASISSIRRASTAQRGDSPAMRPGLRECAAHRHRAADRSAEA